MNTTRYTHKIDFMTKTSGQHLATTTNIHATMKFSHLTMATVAGFYLKSDPGYALIRVSECIIVAIQFKLHFCTSICPHSFQYPFLLNLKKSELPYINEIHYDNAGTDENERVEVAVNATDNEVYLIRYYEGPESGYYTELFSNNASVATVSAADVNGIKYIVFNTTGIWDGPFGFVYLLVESTLTDLERLAYEGAPSSTETDIMVFEDGTGPNNFSLQRQVGIGAKFWLVPRLNTFGAANIIVPTKTPTSAPSKEPTPKLPSKVPVPTKPPKPKLPTEVPVPVAVPVKASTKAPVKVPSTATPTAPPENCGILGWNLFCPKSGKCGFIKRLLNLGNCD